VDVESCISEIEEKMSIFKHKIGHKGHQSMCQVSCFYPKVHKKAFFNGLAPSLILQKWQILLQVGQNQLQKWRIQLQKPVYRLSTENNSYIVCIQILHWNLNAAMEQSLGNEVISYIILFNGCTFTGHFILHCKKWLLTRWLQNYEKCRPDHWCILYHYLFTTFDSSLQGTSIHDEQNADGFQ